MYVTVTTIHRALLSTKYVLNSTLSKTNNLCPDYVLVNSLIFFHSKKVNISIVLVY